MGLSKLNFFNRKEGEKYKYEYEYEYEYEDEYDDDYEDDYEDEYDYDDDDYDYEYEYEEDDDNDEEYEYEYEEDEDDEYYEVAVVTPSKSKKSRSKKKKEKNAPKLKKQDIKIEKRSGQTDDELMAENERLREIVEEQSEYINQLMMIKRKTDTALEQMTHYTQSLKMENEDLLKQADSQKELIEVVDTKQAIEIELVQKELDLATEEITALRNALQGNQVLIEDYQSEIENLTLLLDQLKTKQDLDLTMKEYDDAEVEVELETFEESELINYLERNKQLTEEMQKRLDSVEDELEVFKSKTKRKKRS